VLGHCLLKTFCFDRVIQNHYYARPMWDRVAVDSMAFARDASELRATVAIASLPRLHDVLFDQSGEIAYSLTGAVNKDGIASLRLDIAAELLMTCQRCLGPVHFTLKSVRNFELVAEAQELGDPAEESDDIERIHADAQLEVTQDTLTSREKTLKIVNARLDAGAASSLEQAQAESAYAAAQAQWNQLRRQRAISESQIGLLTGQPGLKVAAANLDKLPIPPTPPAGLPSSLLEARPDVRQAEEKLIAANARIGVAKAAYYPSISLTGLYGSESQALSNLFTNNAGIWSAALGLSMPIFDAGRTSARVDQATASQKENLANYRKTLQSAFKEVNDALVNLREYADEENANASQVAAARRALSLSQARYEAGYSGFMDVLDAQRTANTAQLQLLASRKNRLGAAVDLFKALGGGWQVAAN